jgi:glycerophosphoryl diester phosphodiesterase
MLALSFASAFLSACSADFGTVEPAPLPSFEGERRIEGMDLVRFLDCVREQSVGLIAAHRAGPRPGFAENAISTMFASVNAGAILLEVDVIETADGELVLLHDRTLERTTTGRGSVADMSYAAFKRLRLIDETGTQIEESPPSLAEAFSALDGVGILELDLKGVSADRIVEAIEDAGAMDRVITITYRTEQAMKLHRLAPEMVLSIGLQSENDLTELQAAGMDLTRVLAWLGLGRGNPALDSTLADLGVETAYGDFRGEDAPGFDYVDFSAQGGEVLSIDHVLTASEQLGATAQIDDLLVSCEGLFPER